MSEGIFIVVEGIDGAGKTTQVELLSRALTDAGEDVVCSKEPTDGPWGRKIRESATQGRMSLEDELAAFIEDRKEHIQTLIQPSLNAGKTVILDRYFYSTIAYQGVRGASVDELREQMHSFCPRPDVVLLMDIDPQVSVRRISDQRNETPNEFEGTESLTQVRRIFNLLAETDDRIKVVDSSTSIDAIHQNVLKILSDGVLQTKRSGLSL